MAREAIFVGYRRDDTADAAGRIYDALSRRFGRKRIFKDVDNLSPGADFGAYIRSVLPQCRIALILIGPGWADAKDESGRRRLDDSNDWVRIEIETALSTSGLTVVPVLVSGARMPQPQELPSSLHPLLRQHAASVRADPDFRHDVGRLAAVIAKRLGGVFPTGASYIGVALAVTLALGAFIFFGPQLINRAPEVETLPNPEIWRAMTNESAYARNYERRQLRETERYNQVVTVFDLPMTADRRSGVEIAPGEHVEIFKVGQANSAVVQVRVDKGGHWLLSRQTFWLRDRYLQDWDPQSSEQIFLVFQRALQNEIDETRIELRRFPQSTAAREEPRSTDEGLHASRFSDADAVCRSRTGQVERTTYEGRVAINPQTGERIQWRGGEWHPFPRVDAEEWGVWTSCCLDERATVLGYRDYVSRYPHGALVSEACRRIRAASASP